MEVETTMYDEDQIMTTNDSENEVDGDEEEEARGASHTFANQKFVKLVNNPREQQQPPREQQQPSELNRIFLQPINYNKTTTTNDDADEDCVSENYKWFNKFKTTTCHMFVCHSRVEYVKNERFPAEVYMQKYHELYGNAFEMTIKDAKFYITTRLLQLLKVDFMWHPAESIIKHVDSVTSARILNLRMRDGYTVQQHLIEKLFYVLLIGLGPRDISAVMERINSNKATERCQAIQSKYSWRSEERKLKNVFQRNSTVASVTANINGSNSNTTCHTTNNKSIEKMFELLYKNGNTPRFLEDKELAHELYYRNFHQNVCQLKKHVTDYMDKVSNVRLLIKDLAMVLYKHEQKKELQNLKNEYGTEADVEEFMRLSVAHPRGDVVFNMKVRDTNTQRYRINCFRMDSVHVWVNSMVYSDVQQFNLKKMIQRHRWGTHHILQFDYMYNSMMSKLHAEVSKLVIRYVLSRRSFDLLQNDCSKLKLSYKKIVYE
uniref:Ie-1 n=1 Tax=Cydia pomonella granulosis virus TaxID=28289 RepID=A0A5B8H9J4_GVCP|nr:ie-1 [Cydia pomonella granulovirus]